MNHLRDKLAQFVIDKIDLGYDGDDAVDLVLSEHRDTVGAWVHDQLTSTVNKQLRQDWLYPKEYDQLRIDFGDDVSVVIPDRKVRTVDADGSESFKPARFANRDEQLTSIQLQIQEHYRLARNGEKDHTQTESAWAIIVARGGDPEKSWDEIRHAETICFRCGEGRKAHDPFEKGHRISVDAGGDYTEANLAWVHQSCNRTQGTNPDEHEAPTS